MNATRRPDSAAAFAIAFPPAMGAEAGRSRAGVTPTSGVGGSSLPPMNQSGISTPQSIGATAVSGSLDPKLTPTEGTSAAASASSTSQARSFADGTSRATEGGAPATRPATPPPTTTHHEAQWPQKPNRPAGRGGRRAFGAPAKSRRSL